MLLPLDSVAPKSAPAGRAGPPPGPLASRATLQAMAALGRKLDAQDPAVVREAAAQLTSELFFAPLLAKMREFPFGRERATGGQTESIFGQQLDQRVADTVATSHPGLLRQIVRTLGAAVPAGGAQHATWPAQQQTRPARPESAP